MAVGHQVEKFYLVRKTPIDGWYPFTLSTSCDVWPINNSCHTFDVGQISRTCNIQLDSFILKFTFKYEYQVYTNCCQYIRLSNKHGLNTRERPMINRFIDNMRDWIKWIYGVYRVENLKPSYVHHIHRDHSMYVNNQWEMALHCNIISHRLGAFIGWSPYNVSDCIVFAEGNGLIDQGTRLQAWLNFIPSVDKKSHAR